MQIFSEKETIAFRVDGNNSIGMGHVSRCLVIAKQISTKVMFITCEDRSYQMISQSGFECIKIDGIFNDLLSEVSQITEIIKQKQVGKLIIDTYYAKPQYVEQLSKLTKIVIIGSSKSIYKSADLLINFSCAYDDSFYEKNYLNSKILLGAKYTPVKADFADNKCEISTSVKRVVITTGGTQKDEMCFAIASSFLENDIDVECQIVASGNDERIKKLELLADNNKRVFLLKNITNMAEVIATADVLITAAGMTLYEACAVGTPTITFALVDEQERDGKKVSELTHCVYAGSVDKEGKLSVVSRILEGYTDILEQQKRMEISENMKNIVDGKGAMYIAEEIEKL